MSHAIHYGSSVFEGIRAYGTSKGPAIFRLPDHIDRFQYSAGVLFMDVPFTKEEISEEEMEKIKTRLRNLGYL